MRNQSRPSTFSRRSARKQTDGGHDGMRSHRGTMGGDSALVVILTRRTSNGRTEEAELSVPNSRSLPVLEKVFDQIIEKFNPRTLVDITPESRRDRDACFVADTLSSMLRDYKYGELRENDGYSEYDDQVESAQFNGDCFNGYDYSYSDGSDDSVTYEIEWIEHKIEVPKIEVVEKLVEVAQREEVLKYKTVKEIQEIEVPFYKEVVKPEIREVIREVQVPGKIIEVPKEVIVEKTVTEDIIHDHEIPVSIAQCLQPIMQLMTTNSMKTTAYIYEPKLKEVDVFVPVPVEVPMDGPYRMTPEHRLIVESEISNPQYNSICLALNKNLMQSKTLEGMRKLEEAVKRVNPDMDDDLLVVRHNDANKQFTDRLPMLKLDERHSDKIPMNADASGGALKASVILDKCDRKVAKHLTQNPIFSSFK